MLGMDEDDRRRRHRERLITAGLWLWLLAALLMCGSAIYRWWDVRDQRRETKAFLVKFEAKERAKNKQWDHEMTRWRKINDDLQARGFGL